MANGREEPKLSIKNIEDLLKDAKEDIFHPDVDKVFNHMRGATWTSNYDEILEKNYTEAKMTEEGRENGRKPQPFPPGDATSPLGTEHHLIEFGKKWHAEMKGTFESIAENIDGLMGNAKTTMKDLCNLVGPNPADFYHADSSAKMARDKLEDKKNNMETTRRTELDLELRSFREQLIIFQNFRKDHRLDRRPSYPPIWWAMLIWCAVGIFLETVLNAYFYGKSSDEGLLGGALIAAIVSACIVLLSVVGGRLFTYKNAADIETKIDDRREREENATIQESQKSRNVWRMVLSWALFCGALIFVFGAAIYRDEAEALKTTDQNILLAEIKERFKSLDFFPKNNIDSIGLIMINLIVLCFYAWKGYHWEDVIPEYKERAEAFAKARYTYKKAIIAATSNEEKDSSPSVFVPSAKDLNIKEYDRKNMESLAEKYKSGCKHLQTLNDSANRHLNSIDSIIKARLDIYRIANRNARHENLNTPPKYFKEYPKYFKEYREFGEITIKGQEFDQELTDGFEKNIRKILDILTDQRKEVIKGIQKGYRELYNEIIKEHEAASNEYGPWDENRQDPRE